MADPQRRERLKRIFDEAQRLPAEARRAFVEQACGGDADLSDEAMATLAAADSADRRGFLATGGGADETAQIEAAGEPAAAAPATPAERPGQKIGRYKLLQQIGEGGMGTVWMAEQTTPLVRRVALKVIKLGMDTRSVIARFEAERQALALMDHPHIARVLDAGTTDNGRPYFVMDLVRGRPVTEYADARALTIPERLDLFRQICSAVQHAHQKGVIHRDLKPANVLVSTEDDRPFAKVIDFGIAKAVGQRLTDKTLFTQHGGMVGTLEYMSPEQADASPDVDTRSDVYSLGVMLYELLTGVTPLGRDRLGKAAFDELRRIIREEEPPKPSTRLTTAAASGSLADVARHRKTEPRRLGVLIRGELDWVVMRALEKERGRRYESAGALAEDLRRHAAGEPVEAAPPGAVYRLRKLARRHKGKVAAAAAVVLALLVGLIATSAFAAKARREAQRADAEATAAVQQRDLARSAATRASAAETEALAAKETTDHQAYIAAVRGAAAAVNTGDIDGALRQLDATAERYRGWEWHWLRNTTDQSLSQVTAESAFGGARFSPDGRRASCKRGDGAALLLDADTGAEVAALPALNPDVADSSAFSPDSTRFAAGDEDGKVIAVDARSGKPVCTAVGPGGRVIGIQFSADARRMAVFTSLFVRVHDAETGAELWRLEVTGEGDAKEFTCLSFSPDGKSIAAGSARGELTIYDVTSGETVWSLPAPADPDAGGIINAEFSPDGIHIVTMQENPDNLTVRDATTGEPTYTLADYSSKNICFSGDGRRLLVYKYGVWIIDLAEHIQIFVSAALPDFPPFGISGMTINKSGDRLLIAFDNKETHLFEVPSGNRLAIFHGRTDVYFKADVAFCEASDQVRLLDGDGTIRTWDMPTGQPDLYQDVEVDPEGELTTVTVSADGERLAVGTNEGLVHLFDTRDWLKIATLTADSGSQINNLQFDATGDQLVIASYWWVKVRRFLEGQTSFSWGEKGNAAAVAFGLSRGNNTLYIISDAGEILRVDLNDEEMKLHGLAKVAGKVSRLQVNQTGTLLVVMENEGPTSVLDARTGEVVATGGEIDTDVDVASQSDDVAVSRRISPVSRGRATVEFKGSPWQRVRYSTDEKRLFSIGWSAYGFDVWDPTPGGSAESVLHVGGDRTFISELTPLPDGQRVVAVTVFGRVRIWDNATTAEKIARRKQVEAARREAEPLVQRLIDQSGDRSTRGTFAILATVQADQTLEPLVRTQAINCILRKADQQRRTAAEIGETVWRAFQR